VSQLSSRWHTPDPRWAEGRNPYEWWADRPRWSKLLASAGFLGLAAFFWNWGLIWPWSLGIGLALLLDAVIVGR
jgi:hypothetical protein